MRALLASLASLTLVASQIVSLGCAPPATPPHAPPAPSGALDESGAAPRGKSDAERAALLRVDAEFSAMSVAKGSQAAFAAYLGDDAKSFPPGQPVISGRDAIVADMASPPGRPPATLSWEPQGAD